MERASRSRRVTRTTSPALSVRMRRASSGRSARALTFSRKTFFGSELATAAGLEPAPLSFEG